LVIAEFEHEFVACFGILSEAEAFLFRAFGEAVVGKRWGNDVERGSLVSSFGQAVDDLGDFDEASWPWRGALERDTTSWCSLDERMLTSMNEK
jgi:hypothetical protein